MQRNPIELDRVQRTGHGDEAVLVVVEETEMTARDGDHPGAAQVIIAILLIVILRYNNSATRVIVTADVNTCCPSRILLIIRAEGS